MSRSGLASIAGSGRGSATPACSARHDYRVARRSARSTIRATSTRGPVPSLLILEHVVMLPSMLLVMLLRRDEYTRAHAHHAVAA